MRLAWGRHGRWRPRVVLLVASVLAVSVLVAWLSGDDTRTGPANYQAGFSPGGHFLFQDAASRQRDFDAVGQSGAGWLRLDMPWSVIERTRGTYDWSRMDAAVRTARDRGIKVLGLPAYTPAWARPDGTSDKHPPNDPADFARFVAAAGERYPVDLIAAWEIWNEPNIPNFWSTGADPAAYVDLLRLSAAALREARPGAFVISAGLAPAADTDTSMTPVAFAEQMYANGLAGLVDAVGDHPYSFPLLPNLQASKNAFSDLSGLRELMVAQGEGNKKIWITEYGAPTGQAAGSVSDDEQAENLSHGYRLARRQPWVGPFFFYSLRDAGSDRSNREDNFGVLREDWSRKPSWYVLRSLLGRTPKPS